VSSDHFYADRVPAAVVSRRAMLGLGHQRRDDEDPTDHWIRVYRRAMACRFEVTLPGHRMVDVGLARDALAESERLEETLSIFRDASEIARVNQLGAMAPVPVSDETFELLALCARLSELTGGAFDITSGPLSRCWRFVERDPRLPAADELDRARTLVGMHHLRLDAIGRTVALAAQGVAINLGAIGKGYAVQAVAATLWSHGVRSALVSAGHSSVAAIGGGGDGWTIDIASRRPGVGRLARLRLRDAALGTSGTGEQGFEIDGVRYGHVIDPRTGWPSSGILSATVVTGDAAWADALATAFFVGGLELAREYCGAHPGTLAIITLDEAPPRSVVVGRCRGAIVEDV
jgi:thiamine biosynthesis lipoprotein